jgi:hypothetical protein
MHLKNSSILRFEKHLVGGAGMTQGNQFQLLQWVSRRKLALKLM